MYNVFDIISYFVQGMLLVNLLKETQPRFPFKKYHSAAILLGQYVAVQIFLHYSVFIKSLLYGKSMVMNNSRQSILPVLIACWLPVWQAFFCSTKADSKSFTML